MNDKQNRTLYLFVIAVINILTIVAGIYIGMSDILINSRYGFISVLFTVATVAVCLIVNHRDNRLKDTYLKEYSEAHDEAQKYKERLTKLAEERDSLKTQLERYISGEVKEEYDALKEKCETIEAFRNSFPYIIADGYILYNIMRTNLQVGKFSTWQIVGDYNGELWECSIVRPDIQSYKELLTLVAATGEPNDIRSLDQSNIMLWE